MFILCRLIRSPGVGFCLVLGAKADEEKTKTFNCCIFRFLFLGLNDEKKSSESDEQ